MRAKPAAREQARGLRAEGWSYNAIAAELGVAKSSVSVWCRDILLTDEQHAALFLPVRNAQVRRGATARAGRIRRTEVIHERAIADVGDLTDRDLFLVGVALYWAEGSKAKPWRTSAQVQFINSDPNVVGVFLRWLALVGVTRERCAFGLSIHERADIDGALLYWSELAAVDPAVIRVYRKRHNPVTRRKNTGASYRGALIVRVAKSTDLNRRIAGWWSGIAATADGYAGRGSGVV